MPEVRPEMSDSAIVKPDIERPASIASAPDVFPRELTTSPTAMVSVRWSASTTQSG